MHATLSLTELRTLNLQAGSDAHRPAFICAASGLVRAGRHLYVVADDELHLGVFDSRGDAPGELLRVFPGDLPDKPKKRKKHKPDLEVLMPLPAFTGYSHGALLALGSGSTERRCRGVLLELNARGEVHAPRILDASALFAGLKQHFAVLNLEGGWVTGNELCLLQRGNKGGSPNAVIRLDLQPFLGALAHGDVLPELLPLAIHAVQLGEISGVPLCFSDACSVPGGWLFSAVAEDTDSAYADGQCVGAAIGMMDAQHRLQWLKRVSPAYKIEGIEVQQGADALQVLLVTDADAVDIPASLLSTHITL
ncbi:MAG: hypothetical protein QM808_10605 [Steroidobacteraceae bacterium]